MKYSYDSFSDALYVTVEEEPIDHSEELPDGIVLDIEAKGRLVGVDVMVPSKGWDPRPVIERFGLASADAHFLKNLSRFGGFQPEGVGPVPLSAAALTVGLGQEPPVVAATS